MLGGFGGARDAAGDFLGRRGHLVDGGGDLFGFLMLLRQAAGETTGQRVRLPGLGLQLNGAVLQAGQAGFQVRSFAEHGHFQLGFDAAAVGVHRCDQRVAGGFPGEIQQSFQAALLPVQAGQPERYGEQGGKGETEGVIQPGADHEAELTDENEGQPFGQHRQPAVAPGHAALAGVEPCVE